MKQIAKKIVEIRKIKGLTQEELIMKNKILIILLLSLLINSQMLFAQKQSEIDNYKNGNYITNSDINPYIGTWRSSDGNYTFNITKSVNIFKTKDLDFKSDVLVLKLVDVVLKNKQNAKIIKKPIDFLSVSKYKANTIFQDPTTENEVYLILNYKSKDLIEFFVSNSIKGDKRKGFYFPEKLTLKRIK